MSRMATTERERSADTNLTGNVFHDDNCCARFSRPRISIVLLVIHCCTGAVFSSNGDTSAVVVVIVVVVVVVVAVVIMSAPVTVVAAAAAAAACVPTIYMITIIMTMPNTAAVFV